MALARVILACTLSMIAACDRPAPERSRERPTSNEASIAIAPWNPAAIDWKPFDEGLALAKSERKPVCLVLFTTWCPHCKNYSRVFGDPRLVARAKDFVMIRVDADANDAVARRYQPDGTYVPRTFVLDPDGDVELAAVSGNARYPHFFDEHHADDLLRAMDAATSR